MISKDEFKRWLASESYKPHIFKTDQDYSVMYIKIPKNEDFDYLYEQKIYRDDAPHRNQPVEYNGIYCKKDGLVYDGHLEYFGITSDLEYPHNKGQMAEAINVAVRKIIEDWVADDRGNLDVDVIQSEKIINHLVYFEKYVAEEQARKMFLRSQPESAICYHCEYQFKGWTEENLLQYISDPDAFAQSEAEEYLRNDQEEMLKQFIENDSIKKGLRQITELSDSNLHRIRNIMQAVNMTSAKTVTVHIHKNDIDFTFKTAADSFRRDPGRYYSAWNMIFKDRKAFEKLFGKLADYTPEEITAITYNGKSIYEADPLLPVETEDEGFTMSM